MQEFSSINVSSYDAGALAGQLTEQSRAGWTVVAIVPTGSTVTAYLSRDTDGATDHADDVAVSHEPVVAATPILIQTDDQTPDDQAPDVEPADQAPDVEPADVEPADVEPADPAAEAPGWAAGADTETQENSDAGDHFTVADEPAAEAAPADTGTASVGTEAAPVDTSAASVGTEAAPVDTSAASVGTEAAPVDTGAASVGTEAAPVDTGAASVGAGAAPAGWYADPASRFELRYWDGSQWTEHVSRAGQQYTDPPVA